MPLRICGIAGDAGAGKDLGASIAARYGWVNLSTGDVIRRHLEGLSLPLERERMQVAGNYLRMVHGGDYMCRAAFEYEHSRLDFEHDGKVLITGVRTMDEVRFIQEANGDLAYVEAEQHRRMEWRMSAQRSGDEALTPAIFTRQDDYEHGEGETRPGYMIHLSAVRKEANIVIVNDGSAQTLEDKFDTIFRSL